MGLFGKALDALRGGLKKTRDTLGAGLSRVLSVGRRIDEDLLEEVEEVLLGADMGVDFTGRHLERLRQAWKRREITDAGQVAPFLREAVRAELAAGERGVRRAETPPTVILVAGVNGSGKTTSTAKLARWYASRGDRVLLAAADTFRAAAVEQLEVWSGRIGVELVKGMPGSDPAAVAFDAAERAKARGCDVLIVDTAGRLHTQAHLMQELEKIRRSIAKVVPDGPHEVLLVLDATNGQNAVRQAEVFRAAIRITGLFLAKLDGTAKGGAVVAIHGQVGVPVKFVGTGETPDDVAEFDPDAFAAALFEGLAPADPGDARPT